MTGYDPFFERKKRASRQAAVERPELRIVTSPRRAAAGPVSAWVKTVDPKLRALIDEALAKRVVGTV